MPNIIIDVAAEFTGKKAFDKAAKSTTGLEKSVKSLGKSLGIAFSTAAVLAYAKASVKAAAADQKAQQQLALALKNVGLERDAATAEGYIQRIEREYGIIDDKLRPSYSRLAIATRDTAETQRLMGIAMDISASTGKDLDSVTSALAKAFLGSNTALSKLGVGISKADLATKSFDEVTKNLAATFAGAAVKSADSVSGSMDKLAIATNNAKETIGVGLIEAFANLAGNGDVDQAVSKIDSVAASLSKMIVVASKLKWYDWVIGGITGGTITDITKFKGMGNIPLTGGSNMDTQKADAVAKKAAAAQIAATKKASAAKIAADKLAAANKAKLDKAAAVLDIQKIQIAAALKGKISEEEKTRLLLMQAIAEEDTVKAEALSKKLEEIQKKNAEIAKSLLEISEAKNPFQAWVDSLTAASYLLASIGSKPSGTGMPALLNTDGTLTPKGLVNIPTGGDLPSLAEVTTPVKVADSVINIADDFAEASDAIVTSLPSVVESVADILGIAENASIFTPGMTPTEIAEVATIAAAEAADIAAILASSITNNDPVMTTSMASNGNFGFSLPSYLQNLIPQAPTIIVNNNGSVIMQDEFVKVVNEAVVTANTNGQNNFRPGAILTDG